MKVDQNRADAWYAAISDFLESNAGKDDADAPGSLVTALCRVLVDAMEATHGTKEQKLEAVTKLTALSMGMKDKFMLLKDKSNSIN